MNLVSLPSSLNLTCPFFCKKKNNKELTSIKSKLAEAQQEINKLKLMYEVEKDSLEEAQGEIELLRQTIANNGSLPEEKTIYD